MRIAQKIIGIRTSIILALVLACIGFSVWDVYSTGGKFLAGLMEDAVDKYDTWFPEIAIRNGQAHIREKEPHFIDTGDSKVVIVIDTRDGKQNDALDYLKNAEVGAVLTRDSVITKNHRDIRITPLKGIPDFTVTSASLRELLDEYYPTITKIAIVVLVIYFLIAKTAQILCLALIPIVSGRLWNISVKYGTGLRLAAVVLVPVVVLDFLMGFIGVPRFYSFTLYFAVYVGLLIFAVFDLAASGPDGIDRASSIDPRLQ